MIPYAELDPEIFGVFLCQNFRNFSSFSTKILDFECKIAKSDGSGIFAWVNIPMYGHFLFKCQILIALINYRFLVRLHVTSTQKFILNVMIL